MTHDEKMRLLIDDKYPLAAKYDPNWMFENKMGCPCLWLCESLTRVMDLKPGMKVLDLGCGTALTSIFLAKEFGVNVFATDLWVSASENQKRIAAAMIENLVYPIHAEVHQLPYAENFFGAAVCINSFHLYGNSEFFLGEYIAPILKMALNLALRFLDLIRNSMVMFLNIWQKDFGRIFIISIRFFGCAATLNGQSCSPSCMGMIWTATAGGFPQNGLK